MPDNLNLENFNFKYQLISISAIDYKIFLRAKKPEEKMFAILADFGNESAVSVITKITTSILKDAKGELEKGRRKNQLRMLAQLRTLVSTNIEIMEQVSSFFKVENDIFYKVGEEKKSHKVVQNLLAVNRFTLSEVANFADVSEEFVIKVQKEMNLNI